MGELHLEILIDRMRREFKVECNQGAPQVAYKEAISGTIDHREIYKKQSGGRGKYADIVFKMEPRTDGEEGLEFVDKVKGGNIPKEFIPSVEKGFKMAMSNGVLAGYPVDSLKVTLLDGSFHAVDSDQLSFEIAGKIAFRRAVPLAKPILLEPIMKLEVVTPEENMGDIIGDLNRRRGHIEGMDDRAGAKVIKAKVPLSEMFGYVTTLRTISSGRASSSMEFSNYNEASKSITEMVIAKVKGNVEA
jgi:elongation factor G